MQDGAIKIIINSKAASKANNEDLHVFMDYMNGKKTGHPFAKELDQEVTAVKENDVYRSEFFSWNAKAMDLKRAGKKEGLREGLQKGIQKGILQKEADDIEKMATYFCTQDETLTHEKAVEMAKNILR